jgi:hypothetical protein
MTSWKRTALTVILSSWLLGCGSGSGSGSVATPTPSGAALSTAALKYRIIDAAGDPSLDCGPPLISSAYEAKQRADAKAAVTRLGSDPPTLSVVEQRLHITSGPPFPDSQTMDIYLELLKLQKIQLVPVGTGFHFSYRVLAQSATHDVQGSVTRAGSVTVDKVGPSQFFSCPICLARGTLIATPVGPVPVEAVHVGMAVYTADAEVQRVAVTVVRIGSTRVSPTHRMLTIRLSDGRSVTASPNHPTAGDRPLASLHAGDMLDGAVITSITSEPYQGDRTYDLLPAGSTGTYWADGVLLGSTLRG